MHYVSTVLGIRDPIHKQKIALKAMDVVLFGPPRGKENFGMELIFKKKNLLPISGVTVMVFNLRLLDKK